MRCRGQWFDDGIGAWVGCKRRALGRYEGGHVPLAVQTFCAEHGRIRALDILSSLVVFFSAGQIRMRKREFLLF